MLVYILTPFVNTKGTVADCSLNVLNLFLTCMTHHMAGNG
jgi:hypothetical protein